MPPFRRARRGVQHCAMALEREMVDEQARVAAAIVEEDKRIRIERAQIAHEIDDAIRALMDQTGEDIAYGLHCLSPIECRSLGYCVVCRVRNLVSDRFGLLLAAPLTPSRPAASSRAMAPAIGRPVVFS